MKPIAVTLLIRYGDLGKAAQAVIDASRGCETTLGEFVENGQGAFNLAGLIYRHLDVPPGSWCKRLIPDQLDVHANLLVDRQITIIFVFDDVNKVTHKLVKQVLNRLQDDGVLRNVPTLPVFDEEKQEQAEVA